MVEPPNYSDFDFDTGDDGIGVGSDRGSTIGPPRWVKVFGVVAIAVVLLFVILMLTGSGAGHGPARHAPSSSVTEGE